jgi:hypothetical protein
MKMLTRLRYLLNEGFEVGNISGYDATDKHEELGRASITFVKVNEEGVRRLVTEEFSVDAAEAEACSRLFLTRAREAGE